MSKQKQKTKKNSCEVGDFCSSQGYLYRVAQDKCHKEMSHDI